MKNIIVVNGPNLNLLGEREPETYGELTLSEVNSTIKKFAATMEIDVKFYQSNHEGAIIDYLHEQRNWADGVVLNPGALTHYSYALRDTISAINLPTVEVHLSNIHEREEFRSHSVINDVCIKQIVGLREEGYLRGIEYLVGHRVVKNIRELSSKDINIDEFLKDVVKLLKENFPKYSWVGIYLVEGNELVLHNFIGKPSPHTRIPIGQGICGSAVVEEQTIIVPDVKADPRYLACSIETRSEIVVPIYSGKKITGEIDIDSDFENVFHDGDREILETCAVVIGERFGH